MKQGAFEQLYEPIWHRFEQLLDELETKHSREPEHLPEYTQLYRKVCHFHALAKERNYSSYLVDRLEELVVRGHEQLYRRRHHFMRALMAFTVRDFPALVRREKRLVLWASALLYGPAIILFLGVWFYPQLVYTVIDPAQVQNFESMYNPSNRVLGAARDSDTNWAMFGFYINNNISVAFRTFAAGMLWGLGSVFFLVYNGALLGAVAAHLSLLDFHTPFFTFVIAHGSFELTAIALAGAAGLKLGSALLAPGNRTRGDALRDHAHTAIRLVYGVIIMLVIAAFVEAFWSSNNAFAPWQKYLVGAALWLVVLAYLTFSGRYGDGATEG